MDYGDKHKFFLLQVFPKAVKGSNLNNPYANKTIERNSWKPPYATLESVMLAGKLLHHTDFKIMAKNTPTSNFVLEECCYILSKFVFPTGNRSKELEGCFVRSLVNSTHYHSITSLLQNNLKRVSVNKINQKHVIYIIHIIWLLYVTFLKTKSLIVNFMHL